MDRLRNQFLQFHGENPQVYEAIVEMCEDLWDRRWRHYSMRTIIHALRFRFDLETGGADVEIDGGEVRRVKLNNNHSPYYARMLIEEYPKFKDFFEFRRAEGEDEEGVRPIVNTQPRRRRRRANLRKAIKR